LVLKRFAAELVVSSAFVIAGLAGDHNPVRAYILGNTDRHDSLQQLRQARPEPGPHPDLGGGT